MLHTRLPLHPLSSCSITSKQKRNRRLRDYRNKKYLDVSFNKSEIMSTLTYKTMTDTLEEIELKNKTFNPLEAFDVVKTKTV